MLRWKRFVKTFWLSFHAGYSCRHRGACCSSGWDIPLEKKRIAAIERAIADRQLAAPSRWLRVVEGAPPDVGGVLARARHGACVFHRAPGCAIHSSLGHVAMPSACQHFPRIALIDRRGVFVTLSHYCPTASSLLVAARGPATVVEGPPVLPDSALPEGLDAREALPPSETPRRLMDWNGYDEWERDAVRTLTSGLSSSDALNALDDSTEGFSANTLFGLARGAVPPPYGWPAYVPRGQRQLADRDAAICRFLAAHVFASWMAYQGTGLAATVLYLRVARAVVQVETQRHQSFFAGIRRADLLLRHLVDREGLAARLSSMTAR